MSHHFLQSHIHRVPEHLAVTCPLHFRQNDWDLLCATAVTRGGTDIEIKVLPASLRAEPKCTVPERLAVTCHLYFWQDDWDFLCATLITQGWTLK